MAQVDHAGATPGPAGGFAVNRARILPQIVPPTLSHFCSNEGHALVTVPFAGDLAVAFVLDEEERYCYITAQTARTWEVTEAELMAAALDNLRQLSEGLAWKRIGTGERTLYLCETFDGYDASRILLSRELVQLAGQVSGNLVIAIPHRDYLIAVGDGDEQFLAEIRDGILEDFSGGGYPITTQLFTLEDGRVVTYAEGANEKPVLN